MIQGGPISRYNIQRAFPQGEVLSRTFFNHNINKLVHAQRKQFCVSADGDDIFLWASGINRTQMRARLQKVGNVTRVYLRKQGLTISSDQCAVVAFTRKPMSRYAVTVNGKSIPYSRNHIFLGVAIDRDMSWRAHVTFFNEETPLFPTFSNLSLERSGAHW